MQLCFIGGARHDKRQRITYNYNNEARVGCVSRSDVIILLLLLLQNDVFFKENTIRNCSIS